MAAGKRKRQLKQYGKLRRPQRTITWAPDEDTDMSWLPSSSDIDHTQKALPKKPQSQREATMPAEPDDDSVAMLMEIAAMDRMQAVRYLKVSLNGFVTV